MVQEYIVNIGLPVVERWERCAGALWSLSQGRNAPVPPPYPAQTMPVSMPNGSSTFVYHGHSVNANSSPLRVIDDDYDIDIDDLTPAELESLALVERCASLEADLGTVHAQLTAAEEVLEESLAREANLRAQLEAQATYAHQAHLSAFVEGLGSGTPVRHQLSRHPPPLTQMPTTPSRLSSYRTTITTPRINRVDAPSSQIGSLFAAPHVPSSSQTGNLFAAPHAYQTGSLSVAPHVESLANYYKFLWEHDLAGFIPSLDALRKGVPISSWSEQMKLLDIPADKMDTVMSLIANAC